MFGKQEKEVSVPVLKKHNGLSVLGLPAVQLCKACAVPSMGVGWSWGLQAEHLSGRAAGETKKKKKAFECGCLPQKHNI